MSFWKKHTAFCCQIKIESIFPLYKNSLVLEPKNRVSQKKASEPPHEPENPKTKFSNKGFSHSEIKYTI